MSICSRAEAAAVATVVAMAACTLDPPDDSATPIATQVEAALSTQCPSFGCGANSPVVDTRFEFHELSLVGDGRTGQTTVPNQAGLAIVADGEAHRAQIVQGGRSYNLAVVDGRFVGSAPFGILRGSALVGATITLTLNGTPRYAITLGTVRSMTYFLGGGTTEAYTLVWTDLRGGPATNLCNNIALLERLLADKAGDDGYGQQELMGMRTFESVIFEGDRIDGQSKTMKAAADDTWFNIGCAGNMLSKLLLTRNTVHSQPAGLLQAWERRQATLKMYAADYCGGGTPLTVAGQRLVWQGDLMGYFSEPKKIEARWNENGATCLYAPRMMYPTSALGAITFPDIKVAISAACALAGQPVPLSCAKTSLDPYDYAGALRVSANPDI